MLCAGLTLEHHFVLNGIVYIASSVFCHDHELAGAAPWSLVLDTLAPDQLVPDAVIGRDEVPFVRFSSSYLSVNVAIILHLWRHHEAHRWHEMTRQRAIYQRIP